jgi:ribosomal protein S18 acetylase RimI-like enzyme
MTEFTSRPYAGEQDLQAMIGLLVASRPAERIGDFPSISDLRELLGVSSIRADTRLWEGASGQLAGYAILLGTCNSLGFEIAPRVTDSGIAAEVLAWGARRVLELAGATETPLLLRTNCRDHNAERIALLEQHAFTPQENCTLHMVRPLAEPVLEPEVPAEFIIRPVAGEHEVNALVALHRAAFGTQIITEETRLAWMRVLEYDPELDLVAVAPDGTLAAYVTGSIAREENTLSGRQDGYTDPVATHPAYQRRGLARGLLLTALRLLRERGIDAAWLSTADDNKAMQAAARSAGFRVQSTTVRFSKLLAGG